MRFIVSAHSPKGDILSEHTSLLSALALAMSLSASGMADVRIADGSGPARSPADLYRSMFDAHGIESIDTFSGSVAELAAAA